MSNDQESSKKKYDLEERTARYAEMIVDFSKKLPHDTITKPLINQIIRSGTSIGANYSEADEASSKKDFINKICIANKEAKETKYWLRIISHALPQHEDEARNLWREAQELNLILAAIVRNSRNKS
ncbi:four helix bundle protein [Candidatus Nomurabacteria bacterium]|nr:four helix bundle protein [Candidatus Nomurabacteria bacterium]